MMLGCATKACAALLTARSLCSFLAIGLEMGDLATIAVWPRGAVCTCLP